MLFGLVLIVTHASSAQMYRCYQSKQERPSHKAKVERPDKQPPQGVRRLPPNTLHSGRTHCSWVPTVTYLHMLFLLPRRPFFPSPCQLLLILPRQKMPPAEPVSPVALQRWGLPQHPDLPLSHHQYHDYLALPLSPRAGPSLLPSVPSARLPALPCPQEASSHKMGPSGGCSTEVPPKA